MHIVPAPVMIRIDIVKRDTGSISQDDEGVDTMLATTTQTFVARSYKQFDLVYQQPVISRPDTHTDIPIRGSAWKPMCCHACVQRAIHDEPGFAVIIDI